MVYVNVTVQYQITNEDSKVTESFLKIITDVIRVMLVERGEAVPALQGDTQISNSGLDSLDIAVLVVRLEEHFGFDPFAEVLDRYPQTLGEMAELYARTRS
jgi:acyl carrier protein